LRGEDADGEAILLSYARTAHSALITMVFRTGGSVPFPQFSVTDDQGASYRTRAAGGGDSGGRILRLNHEPRHDPWWLDLAVAPGEPAVRIDLKPGIQRPEPGVILSETAGSG